MTPTAGAGLVPAPPYIVQIQKGRDPSL